MSLSKKDSLENYYIDCLKTECCWIYIYCMRVGIFHSIYVKLHFRCNIISTATSKINVFSNPHSFKPHNAQLDFRSHLVNNIKSFTTTIWFLTHNIILIRQWRYINYIAILAHLFSPPWWFQWSRAIWVRWRLHASHDGHFASWTMPVTRLWRPWGPTSQSNNKITSQSNKTDLKAHFGG